jgi:hypothetical protein
MAIDASQGEQYVNTARQVFAAAQERRDLPDGYAFRLSEEHTTLLQVAEYLTNDRRCCPFFHYTLSIEPEARAVWLAITGPEGVKEGIMASLVQLEREESAESVLAWAADWQSSNNRWHA